MLWEQSIIYLLLSLTMHSTPASNPMQGLLGDKLSDEGGNDWWQSRQLKEQRRSSVPFWETQKYPRKLAHKTAHVKILIYGLIEFQVVTLFL